jgi:hypothetical protein
MVWRLPQVVQRRLGLEGDVEDVSVLGYRYEGRFQRCLRAVALGLAIPKA